MTTKERILQELTLKMNSTVNGEELARLCGVTRMAVWKTINSLRKECCEIQGTTNGGYILKKEADILSEENFRIYLKKFYPQLADNYIECFKQIDSTNTYARKLLSESVMLKYPDGSLTPAGSKYNNAVIIAESQTAGRGRSGRSFISPEKTGIYISIILVPQDTVIQPSKITAFAAVAVCRAIQSLYKIKCGIKWINDIFYNGKKICGILTEGSTNFETGQIESAVIGIGINIKPNSSAFKKEVSKIAGSILDKKTESSVVRAELAAEVYGQFIHILNENERKVIDEYKSLVFVLGKKIEVHPLAGTDRDIYEAVATDITDDASLCVTLPDGSLRTLFSGEISLKSSEFTK